MRESVELERLPTKSGRLDNPFSDFDVETGYPGEEYSSASLNIRRYLNSVLRHLWLVVLITTIGTMAAVVYVAQKPDYYVARARVQVNREINPAADNSKGSVIVSSVDNDPAYFSTQFQILEGSGLLRRVVKTYDLEHNQAFINPLAGKQRSTWQNVARFVGLRSAENASQQQTEETLTVNSDASVRYEEGREEAETFAPYVNLLKRSLEISPVKEKRVAWSETRLIDIEYTHYEAAVASKLANAIADTYVLQNLEKKVENNAAAGDFLQKRVAELQGQIRNGEERLINYSKSNRLLSLDTDQNTVVQRLTDLNGRLLEAENERHVAEAAYRASMAPGAAAALTEDGDQQAAQLESKMMDLREQRVKLLLEFSDEAPEIKDIDKQIAAINTSLRERRARTNATLTTNLDTKYRQALTRETELRRLFEQQKGEVLSQNEAAINYRIIQQEIETNKKLLEGLLQRSRENDVILNDTPNNVLVVDRALTPRGPAGPQRSGAIIIAFFISLGLSVGLAFLVQYLDDTLKETDDIDNVLRLPVIAMIPSVMKEGGIRKLLPLPSKSRHRDKNVQSLALIRQNGTPSVYNEAYLHLRTSILLATAGGPPNKLLVTSSQPSEGKTTTAINLATVLAQTGVKVLLIDADLRGPSMHKAFGIENHKGLTNLLAAKEVSKADISSAITLDEPSGLHIMTTGPAPPNPATLLGSEQMRELMRRLEASYTHIVIDSSPLIMFTDSAILSTLVDGTILVVRSGMTSRAMALRARKTLRDVGARLFGVVLNGIPMSARSYYYDSDYYYSKDVVEANESVLHLG
jgi:capsular exopolysaccharide synthesis family protein